MAAVVRESGVWRCLFRIETFRGEWVPGATPIEVVECDNTLMNGGVSVLWQCLIGNGSGTAGGALTFFNTANAAIGAGDGTAAVVDTQNNLQGVNRLRVAMDAGYPQHTDGTATGSKTITFRSTFGTAQANYDWQEVGVFNSATDASGRMLNRKLQAIGVKSNTVSRIVTATITIA